MNNDNFNNQTNNLNYTNTSLNGIQNQGMNNTINQNNITNNNAINNNQNMVKPKKKLMWWLPVILFLMFPLCTIISIVYKLIFNIRSSNMITTFLNLVGYVSAFLVIPSIIYIIIKYNKK